MPLFLAGRGLFDHGRHFVIGPAMECPARFCFLSSPPLFEEEGHVRCSALCVEGFNPRLLHRSCSWTAFAAYDRPINASERDASEVLQEGLNGKEAASCWSTLETLDSRDAVPAVLDADTPPDMRESGRERELTS
jgi:hypothetical protein